MNQEQPFTHHQVYVALGSNLGDRGANIDKAILAIEQRIGLIIRAGKTYHSDALDFEGPAFYNTCILVHSVLAPLAILDELQAIEASLGRIKTKTTGYESRTIDLDLILYNQEIVDHPRLQLPHPHMHVRNFVLQPLLDINPKIAHPSLNEPIARLRMKTPPLKKVMDHEVKLSSARGYQMEALNFVCIEGNIGSGKTSLSHKIAADFDGRLVLERFTENAFLPLFYENQERFAFPLEMSFLADRYQQLHDELAQQDLFSKRTIADYYVIKSLLFSQITLQEEEFALYKKLFYIMYKELVKPDVYIYLYQSEDRLLEQIRKRGREYEQDISAEYLQQVNQAYMDFIKTENELSIKVIDVTSLDFVNNHQDYLKVLRQICN